MKRPYSQFITLIAIALFPVISFAQQNNMSADTAEIKKVLAASKSRLDHTPDSAIVLARKAVAMAHQQPDELWVARGNNTLGVAYYNKGDYAAALEYYTTAESIYKRLNFPEGLVQVYLNIGIIYGKSGYYEKATEYFMEGLKNAHMNGYVSQASGYYNSLGVLAKQQENYDEAMINYRKSLSLSRSIGSKKDEAGTYGNIANIYMLQGKKDSAIFFAEKGLRLFDSLQIARGQVTAYNNLGDFYSRSGDYTKSIFYSNKARELSQQKGFNTNYFTAIKTLGDVHASLGEHDKALVFLEEICAHTQDKTLLLSALRAAATCYEGLGDDSRAINALKRSIALKDSIVNEEMMMSVQRTKSIYELDRKEEEIRNLRQENEASQMQVVQIITVSILILIIVALIASYASLSMKKKRESAEMSALRAQMNPHFIFNSLNAINRYIVKSSPEAASHYLTQFSKLMRQILENSKRETITLAEELATLRLYIEMELLRFDNQFTCELVVDPSIDVNTAIIPPLILQPYVENAIWHGLARRDRNGKLAINIRQQHDCLHIEIVDNGPGLKTVKQDDEKKSHGMGITLQRLRFFSRNKRKANFVNVENMFDENRVVAGTRVTLSIPAIATGAQQEVAS